MSAWQDGMVVGTHPIPDLYWYLATIEKAWTDGDTVTVTVDFGLDEQRRRVKFRLARIDAYGNSHVKKAEAIVLVNTLLPVGKKFYLRTTKDKTEKWGRYLAEIFIQNEGLKDLINLNDLLVKNGLALFWDGQGPHPTGEIV